MFPITLLAAGLLLQALPDASADWQAKLDAGRQAYAKHAYAEAITSLNAAVEAGAQTSGADAALLDALRLLAAAYRETGDHEKAERALQKIVARLGLKDAEGLAMAAVLEELAAAQRAQGRGADALLTIESAIRIRMAHPEAPRTDLARDLTTAALLRHQAGKIKEAVEGLQLAIVEWDAASPADPQALPALEALAEIYRDMSKYAEAEPLLLRSLRVREAASGPDGADVISTVDSLAYVEFGLKKFPETEALYRRLLALWEKNAGPDHPMTALTHDKMAEFFAAQERYLEAEQSASQALAARTRIYVSSLNQTGRMLLMQAKMDEAEDLYRRAVQIGDLAKAPDEVLDPLLRIYAKVLGALKRDAEAQVLEARIKDALLRKADREGRRPSPVKQNTR